MKDFIFSNYLRGFGFTYYGFSSNLARLRLNFPLIIARIEKHTIVKIRIFLQITVENEVYRKIEATTVSIQVVTPKEFEK